MISDELLLGILIVGIGGLGLWNLAEELSRPELFVLALSLIGLLGLLFSFAWHRYSIWGKERQRWLTQINEVPKQLIVATEPGVRMGRDQDLNASIFLPDAIRSRHVHVIGTTGSGKTESVILNFLKQDVSRELGSIILDAKGDASFLKSLKEWVPEDRRLIFDLGSAESLSYDPLAAGSPLESAQRLFSSLTWSEEYYKSKALSALQRLFQNHSETIGGNPKLVDLAAYLESPQKYTARTMSKSYPKQLAERDFMELAGLRDQIRSLCTGYLAKILSPEKSSQMPLEDAAKGTVLYFRLQSLLSPQLVSTVGKLVINHLNYLAGTAHRIEEAEKKKMVPVYLDEFASFACPEFADLISKARSAGFALHFSHQSIGDLVEVSEGFLNRITDNSATKIVLRINDPDSADFFARSFGTKLYQKVTQRVTNAKQIDSAELVGEGTQREAHQFRASPDLFKTLPTGVGSVLIAHGFDTPHGASSVFKVQFPKLDSGSQEC